MPETLISVAMAEPHPAIQENKDDLGNHCSTKGYTNLCAGRGLLLFSLPLTLLVGGFSPDAPYGSQANMGDNIQTNPNVHDAVKSMGRNPSPARIV